ncbi:MAG: diguanylate cyclase [Gemmatimonadota bacterium]
MGSAETRIRIENEILGRIEKKYSEEEQGNHLMHLLVENYRLRSASTIAVEAGGDDVSVFAHRGLSGNFIKQMYTRRSLPLLAAAMQGEVVVRADDPRAQDPSFRLEHEYRTLYAAPCRLQGETIGVFAADSGDPELLTAETRAAFSAYARLATLFLAMRNLRARISRIPDVDSVTGLSTFKYFHEVLHRELTRGMKFHYPVSIVFVKVRRLREMNEVYGHVAADAALAEVARRIRGALREVDYAARSGGKIYIMMPKFDKADAAAAMKRVVDAMDLSPVGRGEVALHVAVGIVSYPKDGDTERVLIPYCDAMVLESTRMGGNAIAVFRD